MSYWVGRPWSKGYFSSGIESIKKTAEKFIFPKENVIQSIIQNSTGPENQIQRNGETIPDLKSQNSAGKFFNTFPFNEQEVSGKKLALENFRNELKKEIEKLHSLLSFDNFKIIFTIKSQSFCIKNCVKFSYLNKLSLYLSHINFSAAFIEGYFSICGFVEDKRKLNITVDLFIKKFLLRANIHILDE